MLGAEGGRGGGKGGKRGSGGGLGEGEGGIVHQDVTGDCYGEGRGGGEGGAGGVGAGGGGGGGVGKNEVDVCSVVGLQDQGHIMKASLEWWSSESNSRVTVEQSPNVSGNDKNSSIVMDDSTPSNDMEIDAPKPPAGLAGLFEIKPLPVIAGKKDESEGPEQVFGSEAFMKGTREANVDGSGH
jgi:hypothetical protein